jgi:hypothetical protein
VLSRTPPSFFSIVRDTEDDSFISSLEHENLIETSLVTYSKRCSRKVFPQASTLPQTMPASPSQTMPFNFIEVI